MSFIPSLPSAPSNTIFGIFILLVLNISTVYGQIGTDKQTIITRDLRAFDFDNKDTTLNGSWDFFWLEYRKGGISDTRGEVVQFPSFWTDKKSYNRSLPAAGYATYRVTILLPPHTKPLALRLPDINSSYQIYEGDSLICQDGRPGTTLETTQPHYSNKILPISGDTLRLALQIANFHHSRGGGMIDPIQIGSLERLQNAHTLNSAMDWFLTGLIFIMGLLFLGLYIFSHGDRPLLFFGLFCMLYSYRIVGTSTYPLHDVLPNMDWTWSIHLEYLSLFLSVSMFMLYTKSLFPKDAPQKLLTALASISLIFAAITILSSPLFFSKIIDIYLAILLASISLAFYIYWKATYNKRVGATIALLSSISISILGGFLILEYYGIVNLSKPIIFFSYLGFFSCQSLVLPFRFAYILNKAKEKAVLGLKAKNEFLSTMSHEIRTPLNSVIGMAHIMQGENPREDQKAHLEVLLFAANNLLGIVNNILELNRMEAGQLTIHNEPVNLHSIAKKVMIGIRAASNNPNVEFIQNTDSVANLLVLTDGQKFAQILANLLGNAAKFTKQGQIKCTIDILEITEQNIQLRIGISDTGIGIPLEKQAIIFDRFTQVDSTFTRNFEGAGLGLSITKQILQMQGVDLQLNSVFGQGSEFYWIQTFELSTPYIKNITTSVENTAPLSDMHILIVEDIKMNILVLQKFLTKWGATFDISTNGKEAVTQFDESRHHLVLMDLHMPVMDGYQATEILRKQGVKTPIIALTADVGSANEIAKAGMNDLVLKPYNPEKLLEVILNYLQPKFQERKIQA
ncbi:response regulator [Dyadobacter tibetensis]|uniref:response regulator n=1 Tax=Dyadobacter tibetensis TaxID=1211851 RepID=UPI000470FE82|nr:response regulator [Dyadobacter tibetensis]